VFSVPPKIAKKHANLIPVPDRFYAYAVVLFDLLKSIEGSDGWAEDLRDLIAAYPQIDPAAMGFPQTWQSEPFWNLQAPPSAAP
jgi:hypothetical protein